MDDKSYTISVPKKWVRVALIVGMTTLIVAPLTAVATHSFTDVPGSHTFHNDISWLTEADVTRGCNPPANDRYCPNDFVTRGQMAAFMRRLAENEVVAAATAETAGHAASADHAASAGSIDHVAVETATSGPFTVSPGVEFSQLVLCPDGTVATGGGYSSTGGYPDVRVSRPFHTEFQSGWSVVLRNPGAQSINVTFYAQCVEANT